MPRQQMPLPLGPIKNSNLFSNHWLEHRLPLEPEWNELRQEAEAALDLLGDLWFRQSTRVAEYGDEAGLEEAFIQPALERIGWKLKYQTFLRGDKPDYALFLDDAALDAALGAGRKSPDFWKHPALLADAKAWGLSLDRPIIDKQKRKYPPEQIKSYLDTSDLPFAILTNGRHWRLIPHNLAPDQPKFETYLQCDLAELLDLATGKARNGKPTPARLFDPLDLFLRFYLFFSPAGFRAAAGRTRLVERAIKGSSEYRLGVGEGLKKRVFKGLEICIEGLLAHGPNKLNPLGDMGACRANSFTLLYRLLFIMYAEDRGLLPYRINPTYTANRSLGRDRDEIASVLDKVATHGPAADYPPDSTALWEDLKYLFDMIDNGRKTYGVPAYNGGLFDPDAHPFLENNSIPDRYLSRVIDHLGRAPDPHPKVGLARVDYRDLAIQHLGSIYEGLLELHPNFATQKMVVIRQEGRQGATELTQPSAAAVPKGYEVVAEYKPGQVYLLNDKGERRSSGSYYTPNHIVDYIVEKTLEPVCRRIDQQLQSEIARLKADIKGTRNRRRQPIQRQLDKLATDFDDRILALRVLDPAMGSGHFLLRVCQYLAEEIATNPRTGDPEGDRLAGEESTLLYWKRRIVEHCIYGVDLNPVAVELAKLALWVETAAIDRPLTFLDHHLRCGNSLVGGDIRTLGKLPGDKLTAPLSGYQVSARLPTMLKALGDIASMPSETVQQVKDKEKLYRKVFDPARLPLLTPADVWCSKHFLPKPQAVTPDQYQGLLNVLDDPGKLDRTCKEPWALAAVAAARGESVNCFHWQLEFPEAFFGPQGLREGGGFDAIVGNPPYDVLSEKETGHDLSQVKAFLQSQDVYAPSFRGKNNLYKLFICRALDLLAEGGRLGFITPMAILGDDQAAALRRMILTTGAFASIDAFPQKDDPDRRVFREAKLSTAVWTVAKTADGSARSHPFTSHVHPANVIDPGAPSLTLTGAGIPAYDPANLTVVSCSQADWDLAVRIISSGRMGRLGQFAEFFQGEVNETNVRKEGCLVMQGKGGKLVTRGACICLYVPRPASQGEDLYLNVPKFLEGKGADTKAFHHKYHRIGLQESCPQNNFRRIIASLIQPGEFCNHKVNYLPEHTSKLPLEIVLGLLNSRLADWYFRLGSTNAAVSHYQLHNLPCPAFAEKPAPADGKMLADALGVVDAWAAGQGKKPPADPQKMIADVLGILQPAMAVPPYGQPVCDLIVELVKRITGIEGARGEIARTERSHLAPAAQPYQDLIDRILYALAGLTDPEWRGLEDRLKTML